MIQNKSTIETILLKTVVKQDGVFATTCFSIFLSATSNIFSVTVALILRTNVLLFQLWWLHFWTKISQISVDELRFVEDSGIFTHLEAEF